MNIENEQPETVDELIEELETLREEYGEDFDVEGELAPRPYLFWKDDHLEIW